MVEETAKWPLLSSVQLPDDGHSAVTRAAGDGVQVNRCIMENLSE